MPTLKAGKVDSVSIGRGYIEPKTPFVIDFNGARYTLQVEAKTSEDTPYQAGEEYGDWKDYRMTLKKTTIRRFSCLKYQNSKTPY